MHIIFGITVLDFTPAYGETNWLKHMTWIDREEDSLLQDKIHFAAVRLRENTVAITLGL